MKLASWNVRTLLDREESNRPERRTALVAAELSRYGVDVAGLQETRFSASGQLREASHTFFWSGGAEGDRREAGVALAVSNNLVNSLTSSPIPVSDRIISLRAAIGPGSHVTFIVAYAPTLYSREEDKQQFYDSMEAALTRVAPNDKLILLGDFNARVGCDSDTWSGVLGSFGRGKMNENGLRLLTKCTEHQLAITNTFFHMPDKWYGSWQHPRSKHVHLLDYIITRRTSLADFLSTRVMRGAECHTDHYMVRSVVQFCIDVPRKSCQPPRRKPKLAVSRLQNTDFRRLYQLKCSEKLEQFSGINGSIEHFPSVEGFWTAIKTTLREVAEEVLGVVRTKAPDWFTENEEEISRLISLKNTAYQATLAGRETRRIRRDLKEARSVLQRRLREIKNDWWHRKAEELQQYADARDQKKFYAGLKEVYGPSGPTSTPMYNSEGTQLLTSADEISERWREHYSGLLNMENSSEAEALHQLDQLPLRTDLDLPPTGPEIDAALKQMHDGKSAGNDGIPAELWKYGGPITARVLGDLFQSCWEHGCLPQDFRDARIVSIFKKKGSSSECGNYRGISLLCVAGKVLAKVMLTRLQGSLDEVLPESQCGFRAQRSTVDMIFALRQLQEKSIEQRQPLYVAFVDFRKAFDTVDRGMLWTVLKKYGCPDVYVNMIRQFHDGMRASVMVGGAETTPFDVSNGVRQGCVLAPSLFSLFLTAVLATTNINDVQGVNIISRTDGKLFNLARLRARTKVRHLCIRELLYADDAALTASSSRDLQEMLNRFCHSASLFGLQVNTDKTEVLVQPPTMPPQVMPVLSVGNVELKTVERFVYLGSAVTSDGSSDAEISRRIQAASFSFGRLRPRVWANHDLKMSTKLEVYRAVVLSALLYALEACVLYRRQVRRLTSIQVRHLRQIMRISWQERVPNVEVLRRAGMPSVEALLTASNVRWAGHVARMDDNRIPKAIMYSELAEGRRAVGGQKLRFKDVLKRNLEAADGPVDDWEKLAHDRERYREMSRRAVGRVEEKRREACEAARDRRHNPPPPMEVLPCEHCGRLCRGQVGLAAHKRVKHRN